MAKIVHLSESSDWIDLGVVERERTPKPLMELGIRLHFALLSLSNTKSKIGNFPGERSHKAVNDWVREAHLQPGPDHESLIHVALQETVIRIDGEQFWLYNAVDR